MVQRDHKNFHFAHKKNLNVNAENLNKNIKMSQKRFTLDLRWKSWCVNKTNE